MIEGCLNCTSSYLCLVCEEDYSLMLGECLEESGLGTGWIVVIVMGSVLVAIGIGVGVYFLWRRRRGFMGAEQSGGGSQLRATYY